MERGRKVEAGEWEASLAGCRGKCIIPEHLPYVLLPTLFPLPVAHLLLLGLNKGLLALMLATVCKGQARPPYVLSNAAKRKLTARCGHLRVTSEFGRTPRCAVANALPSRLSSIHSRCSRVQDTAKGHRV